MRWAGSRRPPLLAAWFLTGVNPGRPWDAAPFAASRQCWRCPGLVNWDLLAVVLVAGALWAWARDRPVLTGVLVGLGAATKLYPLFLLGGAARDLPAGSAGSPDLGARVTGAAVAGLAARERPCVPVLVVGLWEVFFFFAFNADRGADLGSLWLVVAQARDLALGDAPRVVNRGSLLFFGPWCPGGLLPPRPARAPDPPCSPSSVCSWVIGFLLVNKVYSPQYVLGCSRSPWSPAPVARPAGVAGQRGPLLRGRVVVPRRLAGLRRRR